MLVNMNRYSSAIFVVALGLHLAGYQAQAQQPLLRSSQLNSFTETVWGKEPSQPAKLRPAWRRGFALMPARYRRTAGELDTVPMAAGGNLPVQGSGTIGRLCSSEASSERGY